MNWESVAGIVTENQFVMGVMLHKGSSYTEVHTIV